MGEFAWCDKQLLATALAVISAFCLGSAVVVSKFGLQLMDARSGAAISMPAAMIALLALSPFLLDLSSFRWRAVIVFAIVGVFYPAVVTLLRFYSTIRLGPAITSTILACTTPLFAVLGAAVWLKESVPQRAIVATLGVACGIALMSFRPAQTITGAGWRASWLVLPFAAAFVSGGAQVGVKDGLLLWPNPFAAALIGYAVSSVAVLGVELAQPDKAPNRCNAAIIWFALTGMLNSIGVVLLFAALSSAPVAFVAPIIASYPLVTIFLGAAVFKEDRLTWRIVAGSLVTIISIGYLVSGLQPLFQVVGFVSC